MKGRIVIMICAFICYSDAYSGIITKKNSFTSNTSISSSQVNENFDQLVTELNLKDARIAKLEQSPCAAGFTAINGGRLCVSNTSNANTTMFNAMGVCRDAVSGIAARVCSYTDLQQACGAYNKGYATIDFLSGMNGGFVSDKGGDDMYQLINTGSCTGAPNFDGGFENATLNNSRPSRCCY